MFGKMLSKLYMQKIFGQVLYFNCRVVNYFNVLEYKGLMNCRNEMNSEMRYSFLFLLSSM